MYIASVIVTPMVTCRVLTGSTPESRRDVRMLRPSRPHLANVNFFPFNRLRTLSKTRFPQPFCFQMLPHSLAKTPGVGTTPIFCPLFLAACALFNMSSVPSNLAERTSSRSSLPCFLALLLPQFVASIPFSDHGTQVTEHDFPRPLPWIFSMRSVPSVVNSCSSLLFLADRCCLCALRAPVVAPLEPRCFHTENAVYLVSFLIVAALFPVQQGGYTPPQAHRLRRTCPERSREAIPRAILLQFRGIKWASV